MIEMGGMTLIPPTNLATTIARLTAVVGQHQSRCVTRIGDLDLLLDDAQAHELRRAARNLRDRNCYRLGGAFEPVDGLDLDPVTFGGWLAAGPVAVLLLASVLERPSTRSLVDALREIFASPAGAIFRELGIWTRWRFLGDLYHSEVASVAASPFGRDPDHPARRKPTTRQQRYLVAEICRLEQIEQPSFATRGEAYEWLRCQGGNPRFLDQPPLPTMADLMGDRA